MECAARYERDGALDAAGSALLRAATAELRAGLREGFSELNSWHLWMLRVAELVEFAAGGRR
jgi:hypothetical protein